MSLPVLSRVKPGEIRAPIGSHGPHASDRDGNGAEVGESAQGISHDQRGLHGQYAGG